MTHKGYKFRIYPTKEQKVLLAKAFGCNRVVWNYFLNQRKEFHLQNKDEKKRGLNYNDNSKSLTQLKKTVEFLWLKDVVAQCLQQTLRDLDVAYSRFFRKQAKFPQFKSRHDRQSCRFPQDFSVASDILTLPKLGEINIVSHRKLGENAKVLSVTISKNKAGRYFASLLVEENDVKPLPKTDKTVGIDMGLKDFAVLSNGERIKNPKIAWKQRKKLAYLNRNLSRKKKDSRNREKARVLLARKHEKIVNRKNDFTHKLTHRIVDENQVIVVENLNVVSMMKNRRLARSIGEISWGEFARQLEYKSKWGGRSFVKIGTFFPSSKLCSCGFIHQSLKLKDREWTCPKCNALNDRDLNAARNILAQGLNLSGAGLVSDVKQKLGKALGSERNRKVTMGSGVVDPRSP